MSFLDLNVSFCDGKLTTNLHVKPTDRRHQYLHYTSAHPNHTKRSIVYTQALGLLRIWSCKNDFENHIQEMKSWFRVRGYPDNLVKDEIGKVYFSKSTESKSKTQESRGVPLVLTFNLKLKLIGQLLNKHLYILYVDQETKNVLTPGPMTTFCNARKLSSYLVMANVLETSCISSSVTKKHKINHQFECNEKCLVYLLTCKKCLKQYVGQTIDTFRHRWNNYKSNGRKFQRSEPCMQEHLFRHFSSPGHNGFLNDVSVTFIDKVDHSDPVKRENFLREILVTMAVYGFNIERSV